MKDVLLTKEHKHLHHRFGIQSFHEDSVNDSLRNIEKTPFRTNYEVSVYIMSVYTSVMSLILALISFKGTHLNGTLSSTRVNSKNKINLKGYFLQLMVASLLVILKSL